MLLNKEDSLVVLIDVQAKLVPAIQDSDAFVNRCEWMLRLAQELDVPILGSEQYPKGLGPILAHLKSYLTKNSCIEKIHFSCMREPTYLNRLREFKKNQLVLIGIEAHVCVLQSALEMKEAGFDVYVVVDAVGSRKELDLKFGLKRMKQAGVHLVTSEMVFFEWLRQAGTPEFKSLSKEFL
ncbi:MAG: hydrolase [Legionella sp.]|nr:MAG: hydrolase [Legionella sp.]